MAEKINLWQYPRIADVPNTAPERVQLDKFAPIYPDYIFRRKPNNVGESVFYTTPPTFPERVSLDKFEPYYPDYINRRTPNNVGPSFFWGYVTPVFLDRYQPSYPDYIFRRPPNNVGDFFWNPNVSFPERVTLDRFAPSYPDRINRRPPNNVTDTFFWNPNTPAAVVSTATPLRMRMGMGL